ncbi:hypothetical protein N7478_000490 [Penicillium angulare]|uniref:uncharacterized protein n=1 Tax=Penicillium angulare TaxID=116970 RepID=UPI002542451F|nr:uncharacterized protein N7478_000490 [Penicillium angulare]KAJ5291239.1 hypothetical protein N7478_000490 [Penicillium angulare]
MLSFRPLSIFFIALILAFVHKATAHPIRTSKWIKASEFKDHKARGIWKVFEKSNEQALPQFPGARPTQINPQSKITRQELIHEHKPSGRHYKRTITPEKSIVSVLVPEPSTPVRLRRHSNAHPEKDSHKSSQAGVNKPKQYGQFLTRHKAGGSVLKVEENEYSSSVSLQPSSERRIYLLSSTRFSVPFLNFAHLSFPRFPLPGVFTMVMMLLIFVWIAILTVGLVEVGDYLWNRRGAAQLEIESDNNCLENHDEDSGNRPTELVKEPFQIVVVPRVPKHEPDAIPNEAIST